ncbi:MAG TPA: N-acetylmuramoyl-L-alanine amidase, partial [Candidatus Sumerlaeota bacterium]|nr:N-acetylmuramoyl-L-alanine amidase [Candidatus Sumerlaeota bacterium]
MITKKISIAILIVCMMITCSMTMGAGNFPQPVICDRACWSARAPQCAISQETALTRAVIHHTAFPDDYNVTSIDESKARVRAIQNYHMDVNGWCDVGYHFLTDKLGNNFEGREGSITSLPRGAHDAVNSQSFGYNMMGYYHTPYNHTPTCEGRSSIYDVIAWKMPAGWSPYGVGRYSNLKNIPWLAGHRDVAATACPGDLLYAYITTDYYGGEARNEINARITTGSGGPVCGPTPTPTPTPIPRTDVIV